MMVAPTTAPTKYSSRSGRCLSITVSNRNLLDTGNTRPQTRPMSTSKKLNASNPRRGRTSSLIIGQADLNCSNEDFFFAVLAVLLSVTTAKAHLLGGGTLTRLQDESTRF